MAKGQQRSSREARKPKAGKPKAGKPKAGKPKAGKPTPPAAGARKDHPVGFAKAVSDDRRRPATTKGD